jgi:cytochrome P450
MTESGALRAEDVDLGSLDFWALPAEERDRSCAVLREEAPLSRHQPLEDLLGFVDAERQRIVEEAAPTGGGDLVELIAKRLPLVTISDMIGVPEHDRERVAAAADALVSASDSEVFGDHEPLAVIGEALWTLTRDPNRHVGFGGGGVHYCLAAR